LSVTVNLACVVRRFIEELDSKSSQPQALSFSLRRRRRCWAFSGPSIAGWILTTSGSVRLEQYKQVWLRRSGYVMWLNLLTETSSNNLAWARRRNGC